MAKLLTFKSARTKANLFDIAVNGTREDLAHELDRDKKGISVNECDARGKTPLHLAIEAERLEAVDLFIDDAQTDVTIRDHNKKTPLHAAVASRNVNIVRSVLGYVAKQGHVDLPGPSGRTALHLAVLQELPPVVSLLLDAEADPLTQDRDGMSPVGLAAKMGSLNTVDVIFKKVELQQGEQGVDRLTRGSCGEMEKTLLHLAIESKNTKMVMYVLHRKVDLRAKTTDGLTALHFACRVGHILMIKQLASQDPNLTQETSLTRVSPLHEAAQSDCTEAINFLLDEGSDIEATTADGGTPLLMAASAGAMNSLQLLLQRGANFQHRDDMGRTVLHRSVGHIKTLRALVESLKEKLGNLVDCKDNNGETAVHFAAKGGFSSNVICLYNEGASIDLGNSKGATPLHVACSGGHIPVSMKLVNYSPRMLNMKDNNGRTPLHLTCFHGYTKLMKNLIEKGALIEIDHDGRTQLHYASWSGSVDCIKLLLASFPDCLDKTDSEKSTALHLASSSDSHLAVTVLLNQNAVICDNLYGKNALDISIEKNQVDTVLAIVDHEKWKEAMKNTAPGDKSQFQQLAERMPDIAQLVLDKCVTNKGDRESEDFEVKYNFNYLQGVTNDETPLDSKSSIGALKSIIKFDRTDLLGHAVCVSFINKKWKRVGAPVYISYMLLYLAFACVLTAFSVSFPPFETDYRETEDGINRLLEIFNLLNDSNRQPDKLSISEKYIVCDPSSLRFALIVITFVSLALEVILILIQKFSGIGNSFLDISVYVMALVFTDPFDLFLGDLDLESVSPCPSVFWQLGAFTVFFTWFNVLLHCRRIPRFGIYVVMIVSMMKTMAKVLLVVALFVAAFGFAFFMLKNYEDSFKVIGLSTMKVIVMTFGDIDLDSVLPVSAVSRPSINQLNVSVFEYERLKSLVLGNLSSAEAAAVARTKTDEFLMEYIEQHSNGDDDGSELHFPVVPYIFFVLLALLLMIVVFNVLIGLAVGDINQVQVNAAMQQLKMQTRPMLLIEGTLPLVIRRRFEVRNSALYPNEGAVRRALKSIAKAADVPNSDSDGAGPTLKDRVNQIEQTIKETGEWLDTMSETMEKQVMLLRALALNVKRAEAAAIASKIAQGPADGDTSMKLEVPVETSSPSRGRHRTRPSTSGAT